MINIIAATITMISYYPVTIDTTRTIVTMIINVVWATGFQGSLGKPDNNGSENVSMKSLPGV